MNTAEEEEGGATLRVALLATAATLGLQSLCSMSQVVPSVLAPVAAADLRLQASWVGVMVGLSYLGGMLSGLGAGMLTARMGARRVCQLTALLCALALFGMAGAGALAAAFPALPSAVFGALMIACALLIGVGIGIINPVTSQILFRTAPPALRSLIFSIKQTGVPLGAVLAGTLLPLLLLVMNWESAVTLVAVVIVIYAVALSFTNLEGSRAGAGAGAGAGVAARIRVGDFIAPVKLVWSRPALREMGLVSLCYSANQVSFTIFLVSYLKLEIGLSLVTAGLVYALAQAAGVVGRVMWGVSADRWVVPRTQLGLLGIAGGICGLTVALFTPQWGLPLLAIVSALAGGTAVAWNGVFLSELAALSPSGEVSNVTGGVQVIMFFGALGGPALFSLLVAASGTYSIGFAFFALPSIAAGGWMLMRRRRGH